MSIYGTGILEGQVMAEMSELSEMIRNLKAEILNEGTVSKSVELSVEKYIEHTDKYFERLKKRKDHRFAVTQGLLLAGIGMYLIGVLLVAASPAVGITVITTSVITTIVGIAGKMLVDRDINTMKSLRSTAVSNMSKTTDKKELAALQKMVDKMDSCIKSHGK